MAAYLHHAALRISDFDTYVHLFEAIFSMTVQRTENAAPKRRLWFCEGIQLMEDETAQTTGSSVDHIAVAVEDIPAIMAKAAAEGCPAVPGKKDKWFSLPNGVCVELMQAKNE